MRLLGLHHITAIASDAKRNVDFYTQVLGLRLVKKTVNFDDPGTYHFYYGDYAATPGTILTFFLWPDLPRGRTGTTQSRQRARDPLRRPGKWANTTARPARSIHFTRPSTNWSERSARRAARSWPRRRRSRSRIPGRAWASE
jgi:glyoxalase family protein